jgi:predicted nucleic acid-binding protein
VKRYFLDTSALLTLRDDEAGAARVAEVLGLAQQGKARCLGSFITLMEVLYRVWKDEGETCGRVAYEQCLSLPIEWVHESKELLEIAAAYKARFRHSVADAWIAASAELSVAMLMHKDPEFGVLELDQERLPYK